MTKDEALSAAHDLLMATGFRHKVTSPAGSRYYHYPGRTGGMLRLADHSIEKPKGVVTMITFNELEYPRGPDALKRHVARAVGWYMIHTEPKDKMAVGLAPRSDVVP